MTGDYSRWLAAETAATLAHDIPRPADPWANVPNADDDYAGTELETAQQRQRRARDIGAQRASELLAKGDENWLGI